MKDCLPALANGLDLLDKVQSIINKLRYCQHELEEEFHRLNDQVNNALLQAINKAGEMIDADLHINSTKTQCPFRSSFSTLMHAGNSNNFHTLKKRTPTRWNTILILIQQQQFYQRLDHIQQ